MADTTGTIWGVGRRKEAVARVRLKPGAGVMAVNGRKLEEYFHRGREQQAVKAPLQLSPTPGKYDVLANINGGGPTGQAGAMVMGIARALAKAEPELAPKLRAQGFLTRDSRMVERKKYGRRKARRSFQYSKR